MAVPCSFDESNGVLGKPPEMTDDQCSPLSVCHIMTQSGPAVLSCWKLTGDELEEIIRTKRIWLLVMGRTMPPVCVDGNKSKFIPEGPSDG